MKKDISRKITAYLGLAAVTLQSTQAVVVYTDVNPDVVLDTLNSYNSYSFDLNSDFINDITFSLYKYSSFSSSVSYKSSFISNDANVFAINSSNINLLSEKYYFGSYSSYLNVPKIINTNSFIGKSNPNWGNYGQYLDFGFYYKYYGKSPYYSSNFSNVVGPWNGITDKFIGFRTITNSVDTLYGWIRVSIDNNFTNLAIKDYAYESNMGQGIFAGDTSGAVGITENIRLESYFSNNTLVIKNFHQFNDVVNSVSLYSTDGKLIEKRGFNSEIEFNKINQNQIYVAVFEGDNFKESIKLSNY